MKKLIVSISTAEESLQKFKKTFKDLQSGKKNPPHFEISFDSRRDFNKFVRNIFILEAIKNLSPNSIHELSKLIDMDYSNLNKIILYFEKIGAIKISLKKKGNRTLKVPKVEYKSIEFKLAA